VDHLLYAAFVTLATTGMRRAECLGLRWVDIDLDVGSSVD
jgi:integrase